MARTALTSQQVSRAGIIPTYSAVTHPDGNSFINVDERNFIHVKNGSGGSLTVTVQTPITIDSLAVTDLTVSIAAGAEKLIGPFPLAYYNQTDGHVYIDYSTGTSITIAVLRL